MDGRTKIDFNKTRNFGEKINITFNYISQNFKSLALSLIYILAPLMLIGGIIFSYFMDWYFGFIGSAASGVEPDFSAQDLPMLFVAGLGSFAVAIFAMSLIVAVVYSHMMIYKENEINPITVKDVWERTKNEFSGILGFQIGLFMIIAFGSAIVGGIVIGIPAALESGFLVAMGFIGFFIIVAYFSVAVSLCLVIKVNEDVDFFTAIQRSLHLIRGKWWSTFGLVFIMQLIASMMSYLFAIPFYVMMGVSMFHSIETGGGPLGAMQDMGILGIISYTILLFGSYILYSLPAIALAFQYYNLVEMKEATGLMDKIESMGEADKSEDADEDY